uniref:Histone RNA hairpin-binding protein RNA-binding domain-containing protein n=2 Tax=Eucampia antarctica TaxID=49252 RepID=A0A7S2WR92_9STRA|mmetsp:Transcript_9680/g.9335  ORF Transcript_9680/g.9335 Transcript_9680/m.9335 type:complete len:182 (+) Transcript_9680:204-749(+)
MSTATARTADSSSLGHAKKRRKLNFHKEPEEEEAFDSLDPKKPEEARRMQQRKRTVDKGKNTIGYNEYTKQVPKETRRPKSMHHPRTPDHKVNIPNRRWLGMVSAWRVALHQYDTPDCVSDVTMRTKTPKEEVAPEKQVEVVVDEEEQYLDEVANFEAGKDELDELATKEEFFLEDDDDDR